MEGFFYLLLGRTGIQKLTVQPFEQGDKFLLSSAVTFSQPDAKAWSYPHIGVFKETEEVKSVGGGTFGKPGERGEYTGQQYFRMSDLQDTFKYKLLYTRLDRHIDKERAADLRLNKTQMLDGTIKKDLHIPVEAQGIRLILDQMVITPTQRFDLQPGVHVSEQTPITFLAKHERAEHTDAKEPIQLTEISEQKKIIVTQVGGYPVKWTYYKQDGNLYVQSESTDSTFGGINQTHIRNGEQSWVGEKMTTNFGGDGNNQAIDMYPNFMETEADLNIFWYYTEDPDKEIRVALTGEQK